MIHNINSKTISLSDSQRLLAGISNPRPTPITHTTPAHINTSTISLSSKQLLADAYGNFMLNMHWPPLPFTIEIHFKQEPIPSGLLITIYGQFTHLKIPFSQVKVERKVVRFKTSVIVDDDILEYFMEPKIMKEFITGYVAGEERRQQVDMGFWKAASSEDGEEVFWKEILGSGFRQENPRYLSEDEATIVP